jgi:3-deoxy-D-manno-octulosonic acid (KDO) 8-phosphate synthase
MAVSLKVLIEPKQAENVQTDQYTVPSGSYAIVDKFTATNTSADNVEFSVNLVQAGSSASNGNLVVDARLIAPNETYTFPQLVGQILSPETIISTLCSAGSALTIRASGREVA